MKDTSAAKRYAKASIDSAEESAEIEKLGKELSSFATTFEGSDELKSVLIHPGILLEKKSAILSDIVSKLGLTEKAGRILDVILEKGRIGIIREISKSYDEMADEALNRVMVYVASAYPLDESDSSQLKKTFSGLTGKKIKMKVEIDKSLIGGVVARVGSKVYDGSLSNQLRLMKVKLEEEA